MPTLDLTASSIDITRAVCDIESVSGNERQIADAIETAMRAVPHLEVTRNGDAIIARTNLGRNRRVLIAGHLDTVPVNNNLPTRVDGQFLVGRGTVDMKSGLAVQLKLAAELTDPVVDITWIWYDHEEVEAELNGLGRIAREQPDLLVGDFAILGEPTNAKIEGGCNGTLRVDLTTRGKRAHSARAWVGVNAIHRASPILSILAAYEPREVEVEGLVYRESLAAVGIRGGVAGNVIPDECTVTVNYRFAPSSTGEEAIAYVRELFSSDHDVDIECAVTDLSEGARPGLDAPLAQEFMNAVGGVAYPKYGWTDVARFSALGIPAVNYGPGDPLLAHADDERVDTAQITECERGLRDWLTGA
ncbi:MAG: succinyl-diaminopimelate desuccinylase [Microbacteriaceae bacterium]|nr:succinyl-diaminopimelate desuccinylase [Microbacteriaceae bacterium]